MSYFWDAVVLMASTFFFIAYLIVLFQVIVDLFRDSEMGGGSRFRIPSNTTPVVVPAKAWRPVAIS